MRPAETLWIVAAIFAASAVASPMSSAAMADGDQPVSSNGAVASRPAMRVGVTGTVRGADGKPAAGVLVVARSLDAPSKPIPEIAVFSDSTGAYAWPLRPGRYELTPMFDGRAGVAGVVTVVNDHVVTLDLAVPR